MGCIRYQHHKGGLYACAHTASSCIAIAQPGQPFPANHCSQAACACVEMQLHNPSLQQPPLPTLAHRGSSYIPAVTAVTVTALGAQPTYFNHSKQSVLVEDIFLPPIWVADDICTAPSGGTATCQAATQQSAASTPALCGTRRSNVLSNQQRMPVAQTHFLVSPIKCHSAVPCCQVTCMGSLQVQSSVMKSSW